ncbi:MAG TPA: stage III sporulation protein AB [Candidatus Blautia stercoravium]|nr:stage III sporulation protein AB [Candidatus Blautia stercoravium]
MLKIAGTVLVVFSCSALGYSKSIHMTRRLQQLREIEKMVFLILGEITYRREALPEVLCTVAYRMPEPLSGFLKEVSEAAGLYQGACFQEIFREKAKTYLSGTALCQKDLEEFLQLGEYLGYLDITMQKNTIALYLEQLKREMENLQREMPAKQKLYRSMGTLGGIFLAIMLL